MERYQRGQQERTHEADAVNLIQSLKYNLIMETKTATNRTEQEKELLIATIEAMEDDKINFLYSLFNLHEFTNKRELISLIDPEKKKYKNFDTAYPIDYLRRIEEVYPDIANGLFVYDYSNDNPYGKLVNINNEISKALIKFFQGI